MNDHTASAADNVSSPSPLKPWWLAMLLSAAVLVLVSAGKWKPVGWFPAALGLVLGIAAALLPIVLRVPAGRAISAAALSGITMAATLWVTAQWHMPSESIADNPMAVAILKSFPDSDGEPTIPPPRSRWSRYLERRYGTTQPVSQAGWIALEIGIAIAASWGTLRLADRCIRRSIAEPPP